MTNNQGTEGTMLRKTFENEIQQVKDDVLLLGSMVEQAILGSVEALKKRDVKASLESNHNRESFSKLMELINTRDKLATK